MRAQPIPGALGACDAELPWIAVTTRDELRAGGTSLLRDARIIPWLGDGKPIGCVGFTRLDPTACEVRRLFVAPEARGTGLAKDLMRRLED